MRLKIPLNPVRKGTAIAARIQPVLLQQEVFEGSDMEEDDEWARARTLSRLLAL